MSVDTHLQATAGPELPKAASGIKGLDDITGGGLPQGRVTLLTGDTGTGKTVLSAAFLVAGAREFGEPGVLLTFEEPEQKIAANVRSLGFDLEQLQHEEKLAILSYPVDLGGVTSDFDLTPLFRVLRSAIDRIGAKRAVLDGVDLLFSALGSPAAVRTELIRLTRWLEGCGVTAIVTGERGERSLTRNGIEEYVSDCVIALDHLLQDEVSTRRLRVVKYRGSTHGTNAYPFLISTRGITVLPVTSICLDYPASGERVSTGVQRLDHLLGGGLFRGSTTLVSGMSGTGKTSVCGHMMDAACRRGERGLWILMEESPDQVLRNMRSIGLDLRQHIDAGLLRMWAARSSAYGLESHLAVLALLTDEVAPSVTALDGIASLRHGVSVYEMTSAIARQIDLLKTKGITTVATALSAGGEASGVHVSSLVDTWLLLRAVETNGERNRLVSVLKSRGSPHSNQVREFLLTDHGIELTDVYTGPGGVLTGSARVARLVAEREVAAREAADQERRRHELHRKITEQEAHLAAVQDMVNDERAELERIDRREQRSQQAAEAAQAEMAAQRWADPAG